VQVTEADLETLSMPLLHRRRFLAAAAELPPPPPPPAGSGAGVPATWLAGLRLGEYAAALEALGVELLSDFADVADAELSALGMRPLAQRRFRAAAIAAAPPGGGAAAAARCASARAAGAAPGVRVAEWLAALRLSSWGEALAELGVQELGDVAEATLADLADMDMPPLRARRYAAAAARAAQRPGGAPLAPPAALAAAAAAAAAQRDPLAWLDAARLGGFAAELLVPAGLGVEDVCDFKEVTPDDLIAMRMPALQRRRFAAAAAASAGPPPSREAGRERERPAAWLASARLSRFAASFAALGVERCADFCELAAADLAAAGLPPLQRRRFAAAAAALGVAPFDPPRGAAALAMQPPAWLAAARCGAFAPALQALGCDDVDDFPEVLLSDLDELRLPLLHRRRFAAAAAAADAALRAAGRGAAAALAAAAQAQHPAAWLAALRLARHAEALRDLGVERVADFRELLPGDLKAAGMRPLEARRFAAAAAAADDA
jgi:hypothetical protein